VSLGVEGRERSAQMGESVARRSGGVEGNSRLTGAVGAVIFVLLAIEGVTILSVSRLLSAHVFVAMFLVPIVVLKIATTTHRFVRYYRGAPEYSAKGPPPPILRLAGPLLIASTVGVFATGIAALVVGPPAGWIIEAHKASFIVWFGVTAVHVLGHILETPALAVADWRRRRSNVGGVAARRGVLVGALIAGLALAILALGWIGDWHRVAGRG
jgi:hypothetical protein